MTVLELTHPRPDIAVITNVSAGVAPIAWGAMIDLLDDEVFSTGGVVWTRYSVYFACVAVLGGLGLLAFRLLRDPAPAAPPCVPPASA